MEMLRKQVVKKVGIVWWVEVVWFLWCFDIILFHYDVFGLVIFILFYRFSNKWKYHLPNGQCLGFTAIKLVSTARTRSRLKYRSRPFCCSDNTRPRTIPSSSDSHTFQPETPQVPIHSSPSTHCPPSAHSSQTSQCTSFHNWPTTMTRNHRPVWTRVSGFMAHWKSSESGILSGLWGSSSGTSSGLEAWFGRSSLKVRKRPILTRGKGGVSIFVSGKSSLRFSGSLWSGNSLSYSLCRCFRWSWSCF